MCLRKLASIQIVEKIKPIENADFIEKVNVLGWTVIAKKGQFKEGDLCVYFEIDSLLPKHSIFDFINKNKEGSYRKNKSRKLTTKKMRGVISQGLVMPLSILNQLIIRCNKQYPIKKVIGEDLTEQLGIIKYEPQIESMSQINISGNFPFYVPKTNVIRIQSCPEMLNEIKEVKSYISVKLDGMSATYIRRNEEFHVCSRNWSFNDSDEKKDTWWKIESKYRIKEKLNKINLNIALQMEICGIGIQKNRLGLNDIQAFLFDVYDIDEQKYLGYEKLIEYSDKLEIPTVPILSIGKLDENIDIERLLKLSEGKYANTKNEREGIVIRPCDFMISKSTNERLSFKVISNKFLLKEN